MINVCRSISFITQMLQDNEDEQSTQYSVIHEPRPTETYSDFFSTDFPHATFTFLNKYTFQIRSHKVMQFFAYAQTTQSIYFYLFYTLFYLSLSYHNYCVTAEQKTSILPKKKSQYVGWLFQKKKKSSLHDFRGEKTKEHQQVVHRYASNVRSS